MRGLTFPFGNVDFVMGVCRRVYVIGRSFWVDKEAGLQRDSSTLAADKTAVHARVGRLPTVGKLPSIVRG